VTNPWKGKSWEDHEQDLGNWASSVEERLKKLEEAPIYAMAKVRFDAATKGLQEKADGEVLWMRKNEPPAAAILREQHYQEALNSVVRKLLRHTEEPSPSANDTWNAGYRIGLETALQLVHSYVLTPGMVDSPAPRVDKAKP
jgi:hypothetical protein